MTLQSDQTTQQDSAPGGATEAKRPFWRRIRWWVLGVLVVLGLGGAAAIQFLPVLARPVVQSVAADLGLAGLDLQFDEIGWRRAVLRDVTVGQDADGLADLSIGRVELTYTLPSLVAGRVGTLRLVDAKLRASVNEQGLDVGALSPLIDTILSSRGEPVAAGATSMPFDRIDVGSATVHVLTHEGDVEASLEGVLETGDGASGLKAALDIGVTGDLARGSGRVQVDLGDATQAVRFSDVDLMSDHALLPAVISLKQTGGSVRGDAEGSLDAELKGEVAVVADPARPLPIAAAQAPLDIKLQIGSARQAGAVAMAGCAPLKVLAARDAGWSVGDITLCADDSKPLLSVDFTSGSMVVESDFDVMPARVTLGALLQGVMPGISVDVRQRTDSQLIIKTDFSGGNLSLPEQALQVSEINGGVTLLPDGAGQLGRLEIDGMQVRDTSAAQRFAPVVVAADLSLDGLGEDGVLAGRLDGPVQVKTPSGLLLAQGTLRHGLSSGDGRLDFSTDRLAFAEGILQPQELTPVLLGVVAAVSGEARATGHFEWNRTGLTSSSAKASLSDIGMQASAARFAGISGDIAFSSLVPVRTRGTQAVSIGVIDAGVPLEGGIALVRVEGGGDVIIENAQWPFAGGQLVLTSGALNTRAEVQQAELAALSINLKELLNLVEMDGLTGDGMLGGAVPIEIRDGSVYVMSAKLAAEPGGVIRYSNASTDAAGQTAEGANIAFQALENFHFDVLSVEIDGPVDGDLTLKIVLQGANPDLLEGYPVHLNVTTEGAFLDLLRRGTVGLRALDVVTGKEDLDGLDVERVGPAP